MNPAPWPKREDPAESNAWNVNCIFIVKITLPTKKMDNSEAFRQGVA